MKLPSHLRPAAFLTFVSYTIKAGCLGLLRIYRLYISPLLVPRCRFYPSCSSYAQQSIGRYGVVRGGYLSLHRLLRCGPWHPGGIDEVPQMPTAESPASVNRQGA